LSEGITAIKKSFDIDVNADESDPTTTRIKKLIRFVTAVGYNLLPSGKFEEKIYMYRFWSIEKSLGLKMEIWKGVNPDRSLVEADKVIT
jgi:hypothetical protein